MRKRALAIGFSVLVCFFSLTLSAGYFSDRRFEGELKKAEELVEQGRLEEAISAFQKLVEKYPDSEQVSKAWLELGKLFYQKHSYEQAVKAFEQALNRPRSKEDLLEAKFGRGLSYFQLKNYPRAIESLVPIFEQVRDSEERAEISSVLHQSYLELKNYKEAVLWLWRFGELSGGKELDKAKASISEWLPLMKEQELREIFNSSGSDWLKAEAGYQLGKRYYQSHQAKEAKEILETVLRRYPDSPHRQEISEILGEAEQLLRVISSRIGLILPLSGAYQVFGERALKGALLSAGIFNYPKSRHNFELRVENSFGDPERARDAVKRMILEDNIVALVGPISNPVASAVAELSEEMGVPMIGLSPVPGLTDRKTRVFRNCMTKRAQVKALLDWAMGEKQLTKFAVLYPEDKYGSEFAQIFAEEVRARSGELIKSVSYPAEATDFREAIGELEPKALQPGYMPKQPFIPLSFQALFLPEGYEKIGLVVPQLLFYRLKPQLLGPSSWHSEKIFEHCREHYLEGAVFADLYAPELESKEMEDYRFRYQQAYQEDPSLIDLQAYETIALLMDLIEKEKISSRKELTEALKSVRNWQGPLGLVSLNPSSLEFEHQMHLFQIQKGKFKVVQ